MAETLETVVDEIRVIQKDARENGFRQRPVWPMIVMITPKGWTGPKVVDGVQVEGTFRAHQVPLTELAAKPDHIRILEQWMKSYRPDELFDDDGRPVRELHGTGTKGYAADEREPARQWRFAAPGFEDAGLQGLRSRG